VRAAFDRVLEVLGPVGRVDVLHLIS
jgi:hypothetical protein